MTIYWISRIMRNSIWYDHEFSKNILFLIFLINTNLLYNNYQSLILRLIPKKIFIEFYSYTIYDFLLNISLVLKDNVLYLSAKVGTYEHSVRGLFKMHKVW